MSDYILMSDNMGDLSPAFYQMHGIKIISLTYTMDGETYDASHTLDASTFYQKMRDGSLPTTSQVNPEIARNAFLTELQKGNDILCLNFSSRLSGTYGSCKIAADSLQEEGYHIHVIDTLCACMGQGLLLYYAAKMREAGHTMQEVIDWIEEHKQHVAHLVLADDLYHLMRGGRISKSSAMVGSMLSIKPIIQVNEEGKLIATEKCHGRKKGMKHLVDKMLEQMGSMREQNEIFMIAHADCEADAHKLADMVQEATGISSYDIQPIGPVIGSHTGPGTIALFYLCERRMG